VIAVDSSIVVPASASWHEGHEAAVAVLERGPALPAHAALETYAVITRLPHPHRVAPDVAASFLRQRFPQPLLSLSAEAHASLLAEVARLGLIGGAVYEALIAATARAAGAKLLTRDRRAVPIYEMLGAAFELLAW
jgi:predicted nucleic acid-binding protein